MSDTATASNIEFSDRLKELPPYLFLEIDKANREAVAAGRDIINLGIGDPDQPTPQHIIDALKEAVENGDNHHYTLDAGLPEFRTHIVQWFQKRFNVSLDPEAEIYPCIGTKEGIAHLPLGVINPKDKVLLTDPAYPAYRPTIKFAGGKITNVPLKPSNGFLPNLKKIENTNNVKMIVINYPNNPTSATATREFYEGLVQLAREKGFTRIPIPGSTSKKTILPVARSALSILRTSSMFINFSPTFSTRRLRYPSHRARRRTDILSSKVELWATTIMVFPVAHIRLHAEKKLRLARSPL